MHRKRKLFPRRSRESTLGKPFVYLWYALEIEQNHPKIGVFILPRGMKRSPASDNR